MGDLIARCGDLIPRGLMEEEEEKGWYKDNCMLVLAEEVRIKWSMRRTEN
jgi:hypothetical protein